VRDLLQLEWKKKFYSVLLPLLVDHAKEIESGRFQSLFAKFQASDVAVELTRSEVACLLANAFLCKFPHSGNKDENLNFTW
jgi:Poly (ADP-ribose) glycohydrolase (PARG)